MIFLKISITQKGPIYFSNKVWTDLAPGHAQIFYGNWRWQGGGWVLGVWICMIWDAWFWFFTISYCILCCRNQLMVFMNSLETATRWCRARSRIIKCDLYGILWSLFHCEGWLDRIGPITGQGLRESIEVVWPFLAPHMEALLDFCSVPLWRWFGDDLESTKRPDISD